MARLAYPERNYTPEYWDGHHTVDSCPVSGTPLNELMIVYPQLQKEQRLMRDRLGEQLERYRLLQGGVHAAMAKFEKGTVFVPDSYPHGTLLRVVAEGLNFMYQQKSYDGYGTSEQFGFVVDTEGITEEGKNGILYIHQNLIYGGSTEDIQVGVVEHSRRGIGSEYSNYVGRVNAVEVISMGSGSKKRTQTQQAPSRGWLGNILPQPA